jgi:glutathione S-transferase
MSASDFTPIVYVKHGCPFCLKLRLFLLEAGLLDQVKFIEAATPESHQVLVDDLTAKNGKASFPAAEIEPGEYLADSDALVVHFAKMAGLDPEHLPTYQAYVGGVFPRLHQIYRENMDLKKQLA